MLNLPNLHDGFLDGLWLSEDKCVHLFVRTLTGKRSTIILREVAAINVLNFWAGNIIFDVVLVEPDDLTVENIQQVYPLQASEVEKAATLVAQAKQRRLSALEINPSYGAECAFLFASAEVFPNHILPQSAASGSR